MKADSIRRVLGLTWVGWLNFLLLRWFFVRLSYQVEDNGDRGRFALVRWIWPIPWSAYRRVGDRSAVMR